MATTVVPCGMSSVDGLSMPAPGSWCGASLRSTSANDGPGSTEAANSGNGLDSDIGAGAYRRGSSRQGTDPLPHERRELVVTIEVVRRPLEELVLLAKVAERVVAPEAEQPADDARLVIVIDVQRPLLRPRFFADRTNAALFLGTSGRNRRS